MDIFFWVSKLFWMAAAPGNLLLLCLAFGAFLTLCAGWKRRLGRFMVTSSVLVGVVIMCVPFGYWGLALLEQRIPQPKTFPADIAGIIVLGGSESEHVAAARGAEYTNFGTMNRLLIFKQLADRYPQATLLYSGGTSRPGIPGTMRQADIARSVLEIMMGNQRPVLYERESRTTFENAYNSSQLVGEKRQQPWILVTSAWHLPRALGTFRQQGWTIIPMPVDYMTEGVFKPLFHIDFMRNITMLTILLREICGMVGYYLGGKSDALFPEAK
jgi:uncharacterized SAM-binding protein YcdF (DUF218 family)